MKRKDTHNSGADLKGDASAKGDRADLQIPNPKDLSRAKDFLGKKAKTGTFAKNFEKMKKALSRKGDKS